MNSREFLNITGIDFVEIFKKGGMPMCALPPSKNDVRKELVEFFKDKRNNNQIRLLIRKYNEIGGEWDIDGFVLSTCEDGHVFIKPSDHLINEQGLDSALVQVILNSKARGSVEALRVR